MELDSLDFGEVSGVEWGVCGVFVDEFDAKSGGVGSIRDGNQH